MCRINCPYRKIGWNILFNMLRYQLAGFFILSGNNNKTLETAEYEKKSPITI